MKTSELRAGLEVLVLEYGSRTRLATARTYRAKILCEETFASQFGELTVIDGPDGRSYGVYGAPSPTGNHVALLTDDVWYHGVRTEVVLKSRILGPVGPAEARVAAAKRQWVEQGRALKKELVARSRLERRLTGLFREAGFDPGDVNAVVWSGCIDNGVSFTISQDQLPAFEALLCSAAPLVVGDAECAVGA